MAWCFSFSTRASVATVVTTHQSISRCLRVNISYDINAVTRALWHPKSPATQLFLQLQVWLIFTGNLKAFHHWPFVKGIHQSPVEMLSALLALCEGNPQRDSNAISLSISWCHGILWIHVILLPIFFWVASQALGQFYVCVIEATLKAMGKSIT